MHSCHCRNHLKAWISLVVIIQCLVLLLYLVIVADREASQTPLHTGQSQQGLQRWLVKPTSRTEKDTSHKGNLKSLSQNQDKIGVIMQQKIQKYHLKNALTDKSIADISLKHVQTFERQHLNLKSVRKQKEALDRENFAVMKKSLNQDKLDRKVKRHKKQKMKNYKSRNLTYKQVDKGNNSLPLIANERFHAQRNSVVQPALRVSNNNTYPRPRKKTLEKRTVHKQRRFSNEIDSLLLNNAAENPIDLEVDSQDKLIPHAVQLLPYESASRTKHTAPPYISNSSSSHNVQFSVTSERYSAEFSASNLFNQQNIEHLLKSHDVISIPEVFHLNPPSSTKKYFQTRVTKYRTYQCYKEGIKHSLNGTVCSCDRGWHGKWCSFPDSFHYSTGSRFLDIVNPRPTKRRIINAIPFNVEWELLETRLYHLNSTVDVFILLESNYSMYGDPKPLHLLNRLRQGYLQQYHSKILYLLLNNFPLGGREDGWIVDHYIRRFLSEEGIKRVIGLEPDDLFICTDADELPSQNAMEFLALHNGYSEPFGFALRWSVFGFFWRQLEATRIYAGCTVKMLREVFHNDIYMLRTQEYQNKYAFDLERYIKRGNNVSDWMLGESGSYAGWHCSWCLTPERIRTKLTSAINADFPRWGDFPAKLKLDYIRKLIKSGTWFDDTTKFAYHIDWKDDPFFAPQYVLDHFVRFQYLLDVKSI